MTRFIFISLSKNLELELQGEDGSDATNIKYMFLSPFVSSVDEATDRATVNLFQQNTEQLRNKIKDLVDRLKSINPAVYRLYSFFDKEIKQNDWFFFDVDRQITPLMHDQIILLLHKLDSNSSPESLKVVTSAIKDLGAIRSVYSVFIYNEDTRSCIGEPDKTKRVCRYCHRSAPEVSFKNIAHTISEAFGNKRIKTNDECDECNSKFGDTIEQDFLSLFDVPRIFFHIKKKGGYPHKFVGENYNITRENDGGIVMKVRNSENFENCPNGNKSCRLSLIPTRKFPQQNIYKVLSKYIYGVLDKDTLPCFEKTRKWLNGEVEEENLPLIAKYVRPDYVAHPMIMLFVRKPSARKDLPHVIAEIRLVNIAFIVILPFSDEDECSFTLDEDYKRFWSFFSIYSILPDWDFACYKGLESNYPNVSLILKSSEDEINDKQ